LQTLKVRNAVAALHDSLAVVEAFEGGAEEVRTRANASRSQTRTCPVNRAVRKHNAFLFYKDIFRF
jgi:hypothetical protein